MRYQPVGVLAGTLKSLTHSVSGTNGMCICEEVDIQVVGVVVAFLEHSPIGFM